MHFSRVGAKGFRPADPKLVGPSVAHTHSSPRKEGCTRWPPRCPCPRHELFRVVFPGFFGGAGHEAPSYAGQIVTARLVGGSGARVRGRFVHVDTVEAAGQADPGVQTGMEKAVVRLVGALVAHSSLAFHRGHAVCTVCHGFAVPVLAGRL